MYIFFHTFALKFTDINVYNIIVIVSNQMIRKYRNYRMSHFRLMKKYK